MFRNDLCLCVDVYINDNRLFINEKKLVCLCCDYQSVSFPAQKQPKNCPNCNAEIVDCEHFFILDQISHNVLAKEFYQNFYSYIWIEDSLIETDRISVVFSYRDKLQILYSEIKNGVCSQKSYKTMEEYIMCLNEDEFSYESVNADNIKLIKSGMILKGEDYRCDDYGLYCRVFGAVPLFISDWTLYVLQEYSDNILTSKKNGSIIHRYIDMCNAQELPYLKDVPVIFNMYGIKFCPERVESLQKFYNHILNGKSSKTIKKAFYKAIEDHEYGMFDLSKFYVLTRTFKNLDFLRSLLSNTNVKFPQGHSAIEIMDLILENLIKRFGERTIYDRLSIGQEFFGEFLDDTISLLMQSSIIRTNVWAIMEKLDTLDDVHNTILKQDYILYYAKEPNFQVDFIYNEWVTNLSAEHQGFKFYLPKTPKELYDWGWAHKNCLKTRIEAVAKGKIAIIGVFEDDKHILSAEISPAYELIELRGKANRTATILEQNLFLSYLDRQKEILSTKSTQLDNILSSCVDTMI